MESIMLTLGQRLAACRERLALDRLEFAVRVRAAGTQCSEYDIWRWETDKNKPNTEACCALAKASGTTVEFLVTGEDSTESA